MLLPRVSAPALLATWLCAFAGTRAAVEYQDPEMKSIPLRTHSIQPPYLDSDMNSRWFEYGGDTIIRADQYIRLTSDRPSQQGWLFSRIPLTATNWEIEFEFRINGNGNLHGDGFAFWLTKERAMQGPVFGSTDRFEGLGIFFDTYKNNRPGVVFPYVMAMLGDGSTSYDQANDGKANEVAGCSAKGIRGASNPTKAKLTYFQDRSLTLQLQYKSDQSWTECFSLTHTSSAPITIPTVAYLGFSAETGELSDNHDIISIQSRNLYSPARYSANENVKNDNSRSKAPTRKNKSTPYDGESGGWGWFFFKLILFVLVVAGGYAGWTAYRLQKRNRF